MHDTPAIRKNGPCTAGDGGEVLTVLVLVHNAGDRLPNCLDSVRWADRILCVIDPNTTDGSDEVARRYTPRVLVHEYINKAAQCNWALPHVGTEWTLVLDADEIVSDELRDAIQLVVRDPASQAGYYIRRRSYFFGKLIEHCGWDRDYNLRLFRTALGRYEDRRVHATVIVGGSVGRIETPMYHDDKRDFEEYFRTFQRFTTWAAQDLMDRGKQARLFDLTLRPLSRFIKMYIIRQGFRDGYHGAVLCGLAAFSVFTKYAKLWHMRWREQHSSGATGPRTRGV